MINLLKVLCAGAICCGFAAAAGATQQQSDATMGSRTQTHDMKANSGAPMSAALTDQAFVAKAAQAGMAEVELSELALQNSSNEQVRSFAQQMVNDHGKANTELKSIAQKHGLQVPPKMDAKHQQELAKLKAQSGSQFDAAYSRGMEQDHQEAVALFSAASRAERLNPDLQAFASKTLPTLESHRRMANTLPAGATRAAQSEDESKPKPR